MISITCYVTDELPGCEVHQRSLLRPPTQLLHGGQPDAFIGSRHLGGSILLFGFRHLGGTSLLVSSRHLGGRSVQVSFRHLCGRSFLIGSCHLDEGTYLFPPVTWVGRDYLSAPVTWIGGDSLLAPITWTGGAYLLAPVVVELHHRLLPDAAPQDSGRHLAPAVALTTFRDPHLCDISARVFVVRKRVTGYVLPIHLHCCSEGNRRWEFGLFCACGVVR